MNRAVDAVLAALAESPRSGVSWIVGDPCAPPPEPLREAYLRALRDGSFPYPPPAGTTSARAALAEHHRAGGVMTAPEQVGVTAGAKAGLLAVLASILEPGDELICPRPCYPAYPAMADRLGVRTIAVDEAGGSFAGWPQAVADRLGPRTRAVVLSSPSNPTGATLTDDESRELHDICRDHGVRLICDEAYAEYRFATGSRIEPATFDPDRRTVVQIRSASKTWSVCGWRIGWVVADPQLIHVMTGRHLALIGPPSGPAQAALEHVAEVRSGHLQQARREIRRRSSELRQVLARHGVTARPPQGGFYLWLEVRSLVGNDDADATTRWCELLARNTGVGLWPGDDFGGPGHVRIAVTAPASDTWDDAVQKLDHALQWARRHGSR